MDGSGSGTSGGREVVPVAFDLAVGVTRDHDGPCGRGVQQMGRSPWHGALATQLSPGLALVERTERQRQLTRRNFATDVRIPTTIAATFGMAVGARRAGHSRRPCCRDPRKFLTSAFDACRNRLPLRQVNNTLARVTFHPTDLLGDGSAGIRVPLVDREKLAGSFLFAGKNLPLGDRKMPLHMTTL